MAGMRYQPQGRAVLSSQWAGKFRGGGVINANVNISTGARFSANVDVTPVGLASRFTATGTQVNTSTGIPATASWSLLLVVSRIATSQFPYFLGQSGNANPIALTTYHDAVGGRAMWYDGGVVDSGFVVDPATMTVIGLTFDSVTKQYRWYKNGRAGNVATGNGLTPGGVWQISSQSGYSSAHQIPLLAVSPQVISPVEMLAATANPWQIFADPYEDDEYIAAASTGGVTDIAVGPGAGSLALTGYAPSVVRGVTSGVSPGARALALAGYAPTITQGVTTTVSPTPAAMSITGFAPTVQRSAVVSATPGTGLLTIVSYAPQVTQSASANVQPASGSVSVTGYAPTVVRGAIQTVNPAPAGLTLNGYAPSITQRLDIVPQVYAATIMRATTTNKRAGLATVLNVRAVLPAANQNLATIMTAAPVNRTAALGPATINRAVSFP